MAALNALTNVTVYLLSFFFSSPESQLCTSELRYAFCTEQYRPVCALVREKNIDSALSGYRYYQKTLENPCSACSDEDVIGYVPGECSDVSTQICSTEARNAMCPQIYDPVCAISEQTKKVSAQTSSNSCMACGSSQVKFYVEGRCEDFGTPHICEKKDRGVENCYVSILPVCAYYQGDGCEEELCRRTEACDCFACSDYDVVFTVNGACEDSN